MNKTTNDEIMNAIEAQELALKTSRTKLLDKIKEAAQLGRFQLTLLRSWDADLHFTAEAIREILEEKGYKIEYHSTEATITWMRHKLSHDTTAEVKE